VTERAFQARDAGSIPVTRSIRPPGVDHVQLETLSAPFRYVWPSELDLMARLAGMTLRERWSDWTRAPFASASKSHVSVREKAA
jgi:hypothetical protein